MHSEDKFMAIVIVAVVIGLMVLGVVDKLTECDDDPKREHVEQKEQADAR